MFIMKKCPPCQSKNGDYVLVETVVIYRYDILTTCSYVIKEKSTEFKRRASAVDEIYYAYQTGLFKTLVDGKTKKNSKKVCCLLIKLRINK